MASLRNAIMTREAGRAELAALTPRPRVNLILYHGVLPMRS
jgi:hypothetical protein